MLSQVNIDNKKIIVSHNCEICHGSKYHLDVDAIGHIFVTPCEALEENIKDRMKTSCDTVNYYQIDPEDKKKLLNLNILIQKIPKDLYDSMMLFIKNWPKIKKIKKHYEIIKNPENYNIVRPVALHQFTAMHLFTRNQVFQIISKKERSKRTRTDEFGKTIDISEDRTFIGWGGAVHFTISGPTLCTYDQEVFDALNKIWHKSDTKGIVLNTNLSEIWRTIGNRSRIGPKNISSLKRSLQRLIQVSILAKSLQNKSFWGGGMIDDVQYREHSRHRDHEVIISFNKCIIYQYLSGSYATLNHPTYQNLTPYTRKMYLFLMSHEDPNRKMSLEKWYSPLGVKKELSKKDFKRAIKDSLDEMKSKNIIMPESHIDKFDIVHTMITSNAWDERKNLITY